MSQTANKLEVEITKKVRMKYLLHIPNDYDKESSMKWPLILFLHGAGERGDDLELVKVHGIPMIAERDPSFPFITISPQCPEDSFWNAEQDGVMALVDEIIANYNVDPDRLYLTGLSMGGYGTWHLAAEYPGRFAAIAPICGGGNLNRVHELIGTPTWAFHGAKDDIIPIAEQQKMVDALRENGGNVSFTIYPESNHNSWTETYDNPELYSWFLGHSLTVRK